MLKVIQFQAFLKRKMFTQEDILYFRVLINSELIHQRIFTKAQKRKKLQIEEHDDFVEMTNYDLKKYKIMHEMISLSPSYEKKCETLKKNNHKNSQNSSDLKCEIHNPIKDGEEILINSFPILNQLNENQKNAHVIKSIQENQSLSKQSFIIDGKIQDSHLDKESDGAFDEKTYYHNLR